MLVGGGGGGDSIAYRKHWLICLYINIVLEQYIHVHGMAECTQMYLCNPAHRYMYFRVWSIASTYIILYLRASASIDSIVSI